MLICYFAYSYLFTGSVVFVYMFVMTVYCLCLRLLDLDICNLFLGDSDPSFRWFCYVLVFTSTSDLKIGFDACWALFGCCLAWYLRF